MKKNAPPAKPKVMNVGVSALARETGLSPTAVSKKLKAGQTPDQIRQAAAQRQGRIAAGAKVPGMPSKPPAKRGPGRPATPSEYDMILEGRARFDAMEEAKLRRQKALAERQEIENMLRRGELLPVSYVRKWAIRYLTDGLDELRKGPSELADTLAAETDPLKVQTILAAWMERVMNKWHQLETLWGEGAEEKVA